MGSSSPPNLLEVDASIIDIKYKVFKVRSQGGGGGGGGENIAGAGFKIDCQTGQKHEFSKMALPGRQKLS
jgi:hypothetical protein